MQNNKYSLIKLKKSRFSRRFVKNLNSGPFGNLKLIKFKLPYIIFFQITTEWDRFYRVTCDVSMDKMQQEGSVVVTTIFEAGEAKAEVLAVATPPPITAHLSFLDINDQPLGKLELLIKLNTTYR
jgi:hypothetical protein